MKSASFLFHVSIYIKLQFYDKNGAYKAYYTNICKSKYEKEKKKMTPEELLQEIEENNEGIALDGYGEDKK